MWLEYPQEPLDTALRVALDHGLFDLHRIETLVLPEQSNLFFKLMEERYTRRSTIITTNLDDDDWYGFLGRKEMVGALLSRLRHHCHTLRIDGGRAGALGQNGG